MAEAEAAAAGTGGTCDCMGRCQVPVRTCQPPRTGRRTTVTLPLPLHASHTIPVCCVCVCVCVCVCARARARGCELSSTAREIMSLCAIT
jgi:hypothetical protein